MPGRSNNRRNPPRLEGFGATSWRNGARATRKGPLWSGDCLRKPRGHGNELPPNGTWAVGPTFPSSSARKKPKSVNSDTCTLGDGAGAARPALPTFGQIRGQCQDAPEGRV